jgi:hypothetical protein
MKIGSRCPVHAEGWGMRMTAGATSAWRETVESKRRIFTEGNEGNEGESGRVFVLNPFVIFVTFCKKILIE